MIRIRCFIEIRKEIAYYITLNDDFSRYQVIVHDNEDFTEYSEAYSRAPSSDTFASVCVLGRRRAGANPSSFPDEIGASDADSIGGRRLSPSPSTRLRQSFRTT